MRADRLLSLLMLLQTRGRMTAQALADELEVSVRTVYRDLEALSSAGVPVYADPGPGGGCALLDNYRTHLTGLHEAEVRALFMASMPAALADLGFGTDLKTALLKLLAALPAARQHDEQWVRARVYLDWERWQPAAPAPEPDPGRTAQRGSVEAEPLLHAIRRAVWEDRQLQITYRRMSSFYHREFTRLVHPYGLVAKEGEWHLLCADAGEDAAGAGRRRVFRVAELLAAQAGEETFTRPADFDLPQAWQAWCGSVQRTQGGYVVAARVSPQCYAELPLSLGQAAPIASTGEDWLSITLYFDSLEEARTKLLGLGAGIEVVTPIALRRSLVDFAEQIVKRYSRH
jgi:predicted DNA-binding transcriptional regulator YafY